VLTAPEGSEPAILESVGAAAEPSGLAVIGIHATDLAEDTAIGASRAYPPPGMALHDIAGAVVPPRSTAERVQLVIGIHYPGPGPGRLDGIRVRYSVGDRHYETILNASYHVTALD
jgi:hypothetical protein